MVQNAFAQVQVLQQQTRSATLSPNAKQELDDVVKEFEAVRRRLGLGQQGGGGGIRRQHREPARTVRPAEGPDHGVDGDADEHADDAGPRGARGAAGLIDQANAVVAKVPGLVKDLVGNGAIFPAIKPVPKG